MSISADDFYTKDAFVVLRGPIEGDDESRKSVPFEQGMKIRIAWLWLLEQEDWGKTTTQKCLD